MLDEENLEEEQSGDFSFFYPLKVRTVEDENICMLQPCEILEDCLQYHDELLVKGLSSQVHLRVHDEIGVPDCKSKAELGGHCKMVLS